MSDSRNKKQIRREIAKNNPFRIGDYVVFNTSKGKMTGIIEYIYCQRTTHKQKASITVRTFSFKPLKYNRYLYQLQRLENLEYL